MFLDEIRELGEEVEKRIVSFTDDQIDAYLELKWEEVHNFEHTPHPIEFAMYYSV